jgi:hypothetical protein
MIEFIQIASAVYILVLAAVTGYVFLRYAITGRSVNANLSGLAGNLAFVATVVCAVTTLANIN